MITVHLSPIVRYTPHFLQHRVADPSREFPFPAFEKTTAAVLFCDIAGFSGIAEKFTRGKPSGVFDLARFLDHYIGSLVEIILNKGGDVVKFAGDALFAVWQTTEHADLSTVTHEAAECAFIIKKKFNNININNIIVDIRLGLGAGDLLIYHVGGLFDRRELLFAGDAMNQANAAGNLAGARDFYVSREVKSILDTFSSLETSSAENKFRFKPLLYFKPRVDLPETRISAEIEHILRAYIPRAILSRIDDRLDPHASEIREVSVIFLKVTNFKFSEDVTLDEVQNIMRMMQECLYEYEGSINRFGFDDKGAVLLAAFGLPPMSHTDDAVRAVRAAIFIQRKFESVGKHCVIGIGTGDVFCGSVGSDSRSEYTMHGTIVNNTAGLMQASKSILCDQITYEKSRHIIKFEEEAPVKVKGQDQPIQVYRPLF